MSQTGLAALDRTAQVTNEWLDDLMVRMNWSDRHRAYHAVGVVLQALRDHLPVNEVVTLGAQLPLLVRGVYYEGWHPADKPVRDRHKTKFLARIEHGFRGDPDLDPEAVARGVLGMLASHVSPGEIEGIKMALPHQIRALWP